MPQPALTAQAVMADYNYTGILFDGTQQVYPGLGFGDSTSVGGGLLTKLRARIEWVGATPLRACIENMTAALVAEIECQEGQSPLELQWDNVSAASPPLPWQTYYVRLSSSTPQAIPYLHLRMDGEILA